MIFSVSILAISLSLDALGVGVVYGLRKIKIPLLPKLIICLFSMLYSGGALAAGKTLSALLPNYVSKMIGIVILITMGVWIIIQAILKKDDLDTQEAGSCSTLEATSCDINQALFKFSIKSLGITIQVIRNPMDGDIDKSGIIDIKESLLLGLALSVDAIGVGIGSALAGFSSLAIPFAVGIFQLAFLFAGTYMGEKFAAFEKLNKKVFAFLPGILLIVLAIIRIY
jgi:putative sporulation protein YtaF